MNKFNELYESLLNVSTLNEDIYDTLKASKSDVENRVKQIGEVLKNNTKPGDAYNTIKSSIPKLKKIVILSKQEDSKPHNNLNYGEDYQEDFDDVYDGFPFGKIYIEIDTKNSNIIRFGSSSENIDNSIDVSK